MRVVSLDAFKESLVEELGNKVAFTVPVLGGVPVAESVVVTWIVMAALIALALALTRRLSVDRPGKVQCALEWAVEFLNGFVKTNIGAHWRPFAPWLGTVALYIGLSNLIGVFGLTPPTKDISVTAALCRLHHKKEIVFDVRTDPALLGGFTLDIEGVRYDKSVRGALGRMGCQLEERRMA